MNSFQIFNCPECGKEVRYKSGKVIVAIGESISAAADPPRNEETTIYLTCPDQHVKPYTIKK